MKFYNLMKEHEDDLARIIVSPCVFIIKSLFVLPDDTDPREWQDTGRSKGGYYRILKDFTICDSYH